MAAPFNTTGQPKYASGTSSDGLRNLLLAHATSGHQVFPRIRNYLPAPAATTSAFDGVVNASPAPANTSTQSYDVFINHYGNDTKHGIATNIHKKIDSTGLRVFLDKDELKLGDFIPQAIEAAMRSSAVHIAIFSKNYARSPWCFKELEFILRLPGIFIPIFYHVKPDTLRWAINGKGIYGEAFKEHEIKSRYNSRMLKNWKLALHKASLYDGEIISNQGEEEKAVNNVVNLVLQKLKVVRIDVAKHPVGLDEAEQDFNNTLLKSGAGEVQIVGIWGMGGAGKSTLAKHLFNKKSLTFGKSCFVSDVREAARKEVLYEKQKELLDGLGLGTKDYFNNVDKGKAILRGRLRSDPLLIVLDDVDHTDHLDALLPARDSLCKGSVIIVTTRELHVLEAWGISAKYKMRALNVFHAAKLFYWHAFGQPSPLPGFEDLAQKFIDACKGLPLSLKVFGGLLCGKSDENFWQAELDNVSRTVPEDIKSRLKISYDALDEEAKQMFLDVACFFIGESSSSAIAVWDGSDWNGLHGWDRLVNKCLVDEYDGRIRMHDHLRDLGREIANEKSPYRLWSKTKIIKIQPQQVAVQVRGMANAFGANCSFQQGEITLNTNEGERILQPGSLGLKIFIGSGDFTVEQYSELSKDLVYLQWTDYSHRNLPSRLPLKKLRILKLLHSERLHGFSERAQDAPSALKESLESLTSLEELRIDVCPQLDGLAGLGELRQIDLTGFHKLQQIELTGCHKLQQIELTGCRKLQKIEGLESLKSLETLTMKTCYELKTLPSLAELTVLKEIVLIGCNKLEKIEVELISLRKIILLGCQKLQKIEGLESLKSLQTLQINMCRELNTLPSLAELTFLKEISLQGCHKLVKIEGLRSLTSLEGLRIDECPQLDGFAGLGELISLRKIELTECYKLQKIEGLESLKSLETLKINVCRELNTLPSLAELTFLKEIDLRGCHKLEKIEGLRSLRSLEGLRIYECPQLDGLAGLGELISLRKIELTRCQKLQKIEGLESLKSLETLEINECRELNTLPSLAELTFLKKIEMRECHNWKKIEGVETLRLLETMIIHDCTEFNTPLNLAGLTSLVKLELIKCYKLEKIVGLDSLRSLKMLRIEDCPESGTLSSLVKLTLSEEFELDEFEVHACLKAPYRVLLKKSKLIVTVNDVSVVEPFISEIQARQTEVIIWRMAAIDVGSLKNFFTSFPLQNVVEFTSSGRLKCRRPENANSILICFIIDSLYPKLHFHINADTGSRFDTELSNGIWLWMGVFRQGSGWLQSNRYEIWASNEDTDVKLKEAWVVIGEEGSTRQAFHHLSRRQ